MITVAIDGLPSGVQYSQALVRHGTHSRPCSGMVVEQGADPNNLMERDEQHITELSLQSSLPKAIFQSLTLRIVIFSATV